MLVCGGGPAGVAAALAAARAGASTVLLEAHGCLGGVWTSGALTWIIDHENKQGIKPEILARLEAAGGGRCLHADGHPNSGFHPEIMKTVLEAMCLEAGIRIRLHTRVVAALRDPTGQRLTHVITESKAGREAWQATSIDCTGDGDLAAAADCGFDMGRPSNGVVQPLSLMALVTGVTTEGAVPYLSGDGLPWGIPHAALKADLLRAGVDPSYAFPTLFTLTPGLIHADGQS